MKEKDEKGKIAIKRRNVTESGNLKEKAGPGQVVAIYLVEGPGISHFAYTALLYLFLFLSFSLVSFFHFFSFFNFCFSNRYRASL